MIHEGRNKSQSLNCSFFKCANTNTTLHVSHEKLHYFLGWKILFCSVLVEILGSTKNIFFLFKKSRGSYKYYFLITTCDSFIITCICEGQRLRLGKDNGSMTALATQKHRNTGTKLFF